MDTITKRAFNLLRKIKAVSFSTINNGKPDVRIIDVMLAEEDGMYFLTARGKPFYSQLLKEMNIAVCGMDKNYVTVRVAGDIRICEGRQTINKIFEQNPMMNNLYPGSKRDILEAFHIYKGKGEIFDLSTEPIERERFSFGGETVNPSGYKITGNCTACSLCLDTCPVGAITEGDLYSINGSKCIECGLCKEACLEDAILEAQGI